MALTLVAGPQALPVSVSELKDHLRLMASHELEDNLLFAVLRAATQRVEAEAFRALLTQTWMDVQDRFPCRRDWRLPKPPVQTILAVEARDDDGSWAAMPTSDYVVSTPQGPEATHARVVLAEGARWPMVATCGADAARVRFTAGYGDAPSDVPASLRHAITLLAAHYYTHREPVVAGTIATPIPMTVDWLISPYRALVF